jgi:hypothetical protein
MSFSYCPRCQEKSYEILATHSYCVYCDYSPELMAYWSPRKKRQTPKTELEKLKGTFA